MSSDHAPDMECPECGEDAVNQPTTDQVPWGAHGLERPGWSHKDGSSLCPVIGPSSGYEPAQPRERGQEGGENPYQPFTPEHRVWTIARTSPGLDEPEVLRHAGWVPHDGTALREDLLAQYRRESAARRQDLEAAPPEREADRPGGGPWLAELKPRTADEAFAQGWSPDGGRHGLLALGSGRIIDGPDREAEAS